MLRLAATAEAGGVPMRAAQTLVAASLPERHGLLPTTKANDATQRALQLLETRLDGEPAANALELSLLVSSLILSQQSSNQSHAVARMQELQKRAGAEKQAEPQRHGPLTAGELQEFAHANLAPWFESVYRPLKVRLVVRERLQVITSASFT